MATIPEALNLAVQHHQAGRLPEAESLYRQILQVQPDHPDALHLLGLIAHHAGRHDVAIDYIGRAIAQNPGVADFHNNVGEAYRALGQIEMAISCYRRALVLRPEFAEPYNNLGNVLRDQRKLEEAVTCYHQALVLRPDFAEAHCNLGVAFRDQGSLEEAVACFREALSHRLSFPMALNHLGVALLEQGSLGEAEACFNQALLLNPAYAEAHWNKSFALLLTGNFNEGWKEYEWRWAVDVGKPWKRDFPQPLWDGADISGRTILLHAEQGFGDALQFVRYVPLVAKRGARVILECQPELKALFKSVKGVKVFVVKGEPLPDFDVHASLLSLPRIFGTALETIPAPVSYLAANPKLAAVWRDRMGGGRETFKVGVAWAGNPTQGNDRNRSASLNLFAPFGNVGGVTFYSLQKGEAAQQALKPPKSMVLIDLTAELKDFTDTAALMSNLDLIITVDTAVAHLAGAMGKPVWTLLTFVPDWRWLLKRRDCPWYPTMQLFRQERPGDWAGVVARASGALQDMVRVGRVSVRS